MRKHSRLLRLWILPLCGVVLAATPLVARGQQNDAAEPPADLVITGGQIATLDPQQPTADWLAIRGDRIVALGAGDGFRPWLGPATRQIELHGEFVTPGFIESHGHFLGLGQAKMMLDLSTAKSWEEIIALVAAEAERVGPGVLILGRGWHQEKWERPPQPQIDGYPTHTALSAVSPRNPVILTHASGHMSFANDYAMRMAQITPQTKNPPGGEILRLAEQQPSGVFRETAQGLLGRVMRGDGNAQTPEQREAYMQRAVDLATAECWKYGITSFQDAGSDFDTIELFRQLAEQGKLGVRLYVMVRAPSEQLAARLPTVRMVGFGQNFLTVRAIKISIDGALGAHGAWLLLPYEDMPTSVGLNTAPLEEVQRDAEIAVATDCQLCVHAIGDKANQVVLDIYGQTFAAHPEIPGSQRRWRIEHAQHLHPDDIPRFERLGVIASMQGNHCTSDAIYVIQRLGLRRAEEGAYVWKKLLDSGATICNGTDVPVEPIDPLGSFYASVTRRLADGREFFPEQVMTREQALISYTRAAAFAAFEELEKGTLEAGKLADLTIWSHHLLTCPVEQIREARVRYTIVGGAIKYTAQE